MSRLVAASSSNKKRKKSTKNWVLRGTFAVIAAFVSLPLLYFQAAVTKSLSIHHHQHASHPLHAHLQDFQRQRQKRQPEHKREQVNLKPTLDNPVLTAYLESPSTLQSNVHPLPERNTTSSSLKVITFPQVNSCRSGQPIQSLPIDDYPLDGPFLPWIHDLVVSRDGRKVQLIAQNRRRCDTGPDHVDTMQFWEPQVALFQPIPIVVEEVDRARLATSHETATFPSTRFQCVFHTADDSIRQTTYSEFPFDYEYVTYRKHKRPMLSTSSAGSKDMAMFWLSQLIFHCPIPTDFQNRSAGELYLDLVPIRTPARTQWLLTPNHTGPEEYAQLLKQTSTIFNASSVFGDHHYLPLPQNAGRWANLPICPRPKNEQQYKFVGCTWTSASYTRRGDVIRVSDSAARLREWIHFHLMVGMDHVYVYDNSDMTNISSTTNTPLYEVVREFSPSQVTYHRWPCKVCNNHRPAHRNPGERSSQYAAEASCRERYGQLSEWMTFLDTDEYLIPMKKSTEGKYHWHHILDTMKEARRPILQFLSSRARPREELMAVLSDQSVCVDPHTVHGPNADKTEPCIGPTLDKNPFLQIYNCDYIRPPKPSRFMRARKQIYQTSHVLLHFVHYATVTGEVAQTYDEYQQLVNRTNIEKYVAALGHGKKEVFMDEFKEGALLHARSIMPHETRRRSAECALNSSVACTLGYVCQSSVQFVDELHQKNVFHNPDGKFCNCWKNDVVEETLVPLLRERMQTHRQ